MSLGRNGTKPTLNRTYVTWLSLSVLSILLFFQNCSVPVFTDPTESINSKLSSGNNGYGYNGKLEFIKVADSGFCTDGDISEIRISVRLNQHPLPNAAFIERENCLNIPPRDLKLGEEVILAADLQSVSYVTEKSTSTLSRGPTATTPALVEGPHLYVSTAGSDSNPGTQSQPFRTIQKGADSAEPGTTVHVAPGTYAERVVLTKSGTEEARIKIVSDTKWGAIIRPVGIINDLWYHSAEYVDLVGFEIDGSASPNVYRGVTLTGSHSSIQNNHIHHVAVTTPCNNSGASAVMVSGGSRGFIDEHVIGNTIHHIGTKSCHWHRAVMFTGTGSIMNNLVYMAPGGIETWHNNHHVLIANNTLFNNDRGINIGSGDYVLAPAPADYMTIINNIVAYVSDTGYAEYSGVGTHITYANNLSFGNGTNWSLAAGRSNPGSLSVDPMFVDYRPDGSGDYRLQLSSPAIDNGTLISAPTLDILGLVRGRAPDLGAFESKP